MYQTNKNINIKQGDSNLIPCQLLNDDDTPLDISNIQIQSQIKDVSGRLISNMQIYIDNAQNGAFFIAIDKTVPCGVYFTDVQFIQNDVTAHSEIFKINIKETITNG